MKISNIFIHHSGGRGSDNYASTADLTSKQISDYHKSLWNFSSKHIGNECRYAGYNVIYDPKTRKFTQCRSVGEETAAVRGWNKNSFHICIIGNYNSKPLHPEQQIDFLYTQIVEDVVFYLADLIDGNRRNLIVAPNTELDLSRNKVYPHRFAYATMCYGTGIDDNFYRQKLMSYKRVDDGLKETTPISAEIRELIALLLQLIKLGIIKIGGKPLGSKDDREDPENFNQ